MLIYTKWYTLLTILISEISQLEASEKSCNTCVGNKNKVLTYQIEPQMTSLKVKQFEAEAEASLQEDKIIFKISINEKR